MKIILPYKKDVFLEDSVYEITSISLENQLSVNEYLVQGTLYVTGEYLVSESSNTVIPFNIELPISIAIDNNYDTSGAKCDIDDFYYEIVNNQTLSISVDISVDKIKELKIDVLDRKVSVLDDRCIDVDEVEEINEDDSNNNVEDNNIDTANNIDSLFNNLDNNETYKTYSIYIIRDNDTIDNILTKYDIDIDTVKEYNDVSDLKVGDKIIIPSK